MPGTGWLMRFERLKNEEYEIIYSISCHVFYSWANYVSLKRKSKTSISQMMEDCKYQLKIGRFLNQKRAR